MAGADGEALRELAGLSRASRDEDVDDLVQPSLVEVGILRPITARDAQVLVLRDMAVDFLQGRTSLQTVTGWAHTMIGHEGPQIAQPVVELDDQADVAGSIADIDSRPVLEVFVAAAGPVIEQLTAIQPHSV